MVPPALLPLFDEVRAAGGRALVVGGAARDFLRGSPVKDLDLEVHGIAVDTLVGILGRWGSVNEVGRSFGVLKLRWKGREIDVSVPRRDSQAGDGHRTIRATADPHMGVREAARRRDLTINAIAWDPLARVWEDPFGGRRDLADGVLRAVDDETFGEDPLRALRVAQFAGRFGFRPTAELEALCAGMALDGLPAERVRGEVEKLLLRAPRPSAGWAFAHRAGIWTRVLPTWDRPCPPALDRVAGAPVEEPPRRLALLYAAACGREPADPLDRLRVHRWEGYAVRRQVEFLCRRADGPTPDAAAARRLADEGELELLALLRDDPALLELAGALGVLREPLAPLLQGRDLAALGYRPGPEMGRLLGEIRERQLDGALTTREAAVAWLAAR